MAENKKSFVAYTDWGDTFQALPDDKAGQLIKHLFDYVNDKNPKSDDILINAVFANIKQTLKRDLRKYEIIREKRSLAGKASADKKQQVLTSVESTQQTSTNSTVSVNDNVNVNDNVKEDSKVSAKKAEIDFIDQIIQLFVEAHGDYLIVNNGEERKMAAKILGIYKKKYPAATSEETLQALKQYFSDCVNISDAWLKTNMSLPIIISKFNQINKVLKNGTNKPGGATNKELTDMLAGKLGIDR